MNISWGFKAAGALGWHLYNLHVLSVLKSGSLSFLEPSGPAQACNGIAVPLTQLYLSLTAYSLNSTTLKILMENLFWKSWRVFLLRQTQRKPNGRAATLSKFIAELTLIVNNIKILRVTTMPLWRIYVAGNNTTYLGLQVKFGIFCSVFIKFGVSPERFSWKSPTPNFTG